jgi:hypothetical protein
MGICVAALLALAPASAEATDFVVNTTTDLPADNNCAGVCSIRDALNLAGAGDRVLLPAGTFNLSTQLDELDLNGATMVGAGARSTIIDGGDAIRLMATQNAPNNAASPQISGVTFRNGSTAATPGGGAIFVSGTLGLANSAVLSSTASGGDGGGIGLQSGANLLLINSTVAGNTTTGAGRGGGIASANEATFVELVNSTVTGNSAAGDGGGLWGGGGSHFFLLNSTVAGNTSPTVGGLLSADDTTIQNTILYGNSGPQCSIDGIVTQNNSLSQDGTCGLSGNGSITGVNPGLGPLANNGGPTDTRALAPNSIAVNHGGAGCQTTDQRGVARPQGGVCDIGAYEYRPPRLTVIKRVVNDQGGTQSPADFTVHVRLNGADVSGSPKPGSATGTTYGVAPGTYVVSEDADSRYTAAISGNCATNGVVTLTEGQSKSCTITNSDKPPIVGKVINAVPKRGVVKVKFPGRKFHRLREGEQLPNGTIVDTRKGRITLFAAANKNGGLAKADFFDGLFKLTQSKGKKPLVTLTLTEKLSCKGAGKAASAAKKKKKKRRLWGDGKGKFRTKGQFSSATVRGTRWLVEDRCTSTLTRVKRGKVAVRDFVKHKTVLVKKNHKYIARKRR